MLKYQKAKFNVLLFMLAVVFCGPIQSVSAQGASKHNVTGTVVDVNGEPLIGVTVQVKGSNIGAITDFNGNFSLSGVSSNSSITASYVGYVAKSVRAGGQSNLKIVLSEDLQALDEVVVVGY